jgi:protein-tyrosine phosphatase
MAEALLRQGLVSAGLADCQVGSAGLGALVDHPADEKTLALMHNKNIDIAGHRARQLDKEMIRKADLILAMENKHKLSIEEMEPSSKGKVFRLGHWDGFDVPDPYRKDMAAFERALVLIEEGVSSWLKKIA